MAENTIFDNDDNVFENVGFDNGDEVSSSGPDPIDIEKVTIAEILGNWDEAPLEFRQQIKEFIERDNIDLGELSSQDLISMSVAARMEIEHRRKQAEEKKAQSNGTNKNGSNSNNAKADQTGNSQSGNPVPTPPTSPASQGPSSPGLASGNNGAQSPSPKKPKSPKKSTSSVGNNDTGNNSSCQQNKPKKNPYATGKNKMPSPIKYSNNNSGSGNQMYKMADRMHRMHLNNYGNNNQANNNFFPSSGGNGPRPTGSHCNQNNFCKNNTNSYQNKFYNNSSYNKTSQNQVTLLTIRKIIIYHDFAVEQLESDDFAWKKDLTNKLKGLILEKACYMDEDCCYLKYLRNIFYFLTSKGVGLKENLMFKYNNLSKYINETAFEYCNRIKAAFRNAYPGVDHRFDDGLRTRCLNSLDHDTRGSVEAELRRFKVPGGHCDNEQLLQIIDNVEEFNRVTYGRVDVNAGFYSDRQKDNSRKNDNYRQIDDLNRSFKQTNSDNTRTRRRTSSVREENKNLYDLEELLSPTYSRQGPCGHYIGHFTYCNICRKSCRLCGRDHDLFSCYLYLKSNGPVSTKMIGFNNIGTPHINRTLTDVNVCADVKNVVINKVAYSNKLNKTSNKVIGKNKKRVNKLKKLNANQLAKVLQRETSECSSTDQSEATTTKDQLKENKKVRFNNKKSEVLFKEGWKINELTNKSVIKDIKIDFDKIPLNEDFIILDNDVEIAEVENKIEIMHDTNLELNKICKINNKFENIVLDVTNINKNNDYVPMEIVSLDWNNNIRVNVPDTPDAEVDQLINFDVMKVTGEDFNTVLNEELPTSELQIVPKTANIKWPSRSVNRSDNYNNYINNESYNVSSHNFLNNQCNYKINEEFDCFSEAMTSLIQPPFAFFRLLFACIFAILNNFNNTLNKANIASVGCFKSDKFVNRSKFKNNYVYNVNSNANKANEGSRQALKDLLFSADFLFDLPYKNNDTAEFLQHATVMTDSVDCSVGSTVRAPDNNTGVRSSGVMEDKTVNTEEMGEHANCFVDNKNNKSNDIFTIYVGLGKHVVLALADSGAVYSSIHPDLVRQLDIPTHGLPYP
ncbi:unnamed protein product, partial [Rotaria magnacalcarata]